MSPVVVLKKKNTAAADAAVDISSSVKEEEQGNKKNKKKTYACANCDTHFKDKNSQILHDIADHGAIYYRVSCSLKFNTITYRSLTYAAAVPV